MMDFDQNEVFESFEQEFNKKKKRKRNNPRFPSWAIILIFAIAAAAVILTKNGGRVSVSTMTPSPANTDVFGAALEITEEKTTVGDHSIDSSAEKEPTKNTAETRAVTSEITKIVKTAASAEGTPSEINNTAESAALDSVIPTATNPGMENPPENAATEYAPSTKESFLPEENLTTATALSVQITPQVRDSEQESADKLRPTATAVTQPVIIQPIFSTNQASPSTEEQSAATPDNESEKVIPALRMTAEYQETRSVPTDVLPEGPVVLPRQQAEEAEESSNQTTQESSEETQAIFLSAAQTSTTETPAQTAEEILPVSASAVPALSTLHPENPSILNQPSAEVLPVSASAVPVLSTLVPDDHSILNQPSAEAPPVTGSAIPALSTQLPDDHSTFTQPSAEALPVSASAIPALSTQLPDDHSTFTQPSAEALPVSQTAVPIQITQGPVEVSTAVQPTVETLPGSKPTPDQIKEDHSNWFTRLFNRIFHHDQDTTVQTPEPVVPQIENTLITPVIPTADPTVTLMSTEASQFQTAIRITDETAPTQMAIQTASDTNPSVTQATSLTGETQPVTTGKKPSDQHAENDNPLWIQDGNTQEPDPEKTDPSPVQVSQTQEPQALDLNLHLSPSLDQETENHETVENTATPEMAMSSEETPSGNIEVPLTIMDPRDNPNTPTNIPEQPEELPETGFAQDWNLPLFLGILLLLIIVIISVRKLRHR